MHNSYQNHTFKNNLTKMELNEVSCFFCCDNFARHIELGLVRKLIVIIEYTQAAVCKGSTGRGFEGRKSEISTRKVHELRCCHTQSMLRLSTRLFAVIFRLLPTSCLPDFPLFTTSQSKTIHALANGRHNPGSQKINFSNCTRTSERRKQNYSCRSFSFLSQIMQLVAAMSVTSVHSSHLPLRHFIFLLAFFRAKRKTVSFAVNCEQCTMTLGILFCSNDF